MLSRKLYAFTLKDNRRETTDYEFVFSEFVKKGCDILCRSLEYDVKGKPHYHGVIEVPRSIRFPARQLQFRYIHSFYRQLKTYKDLSWWMIYCDKDQDDLMPECKEEYVEPPKIKMFN